MYKLTIEFKTLEELNDFVAPKIGLKQVEEKLPSVIAEEEKKPKASKKKQVEAVEEAPAPIGKVFVAPEEVEKKSPPVDRGALIGVASELINSLKGLNLDGDTIMKHVMSVYSSVGAPSDKRISELDDNILSKFVPALADKTQELLNTGKNPVNFI